jgi:hypothetical protein
LEGTRQPQRKAIETVEHRELALLLNGMTSNSHAIQDEPELIVARHHFRSGPKSYLRIGWRDVPRVLGDGATGFEIDTTRLTLTRGSDGLQAGTE